ncbi:hypothetical protein [Streptomyces rubellomurinus]|uniref:Uncharacterized protein n=2 Tax=Streptomyces TaxID=1883 RepID=A0A0F2TEF1_STRR3|nr:hypothetical protein [Streptomyces rubellomurinus]KJS61519.1 hypothetical protein VM95_14580 [Streptomyces rubellomurinus]
MDKDQLAHLEQRINHLVTVTKSVTTDDYEDLRKIIHRPGFTTPAELALIAGAVEVLIRQTETVAEARRGLMDGARAVGATG